MTEYEKRSRAACPHCAAGLARFKDGTGYNFHLVCVTKTPLVTKREECAALLPVALIEQMAEQLRMVREALKKAAHTMDCGSRIPGGVMPRIGAVYSCNCFKSRILSLLDGPQPKDQSLPAADSSRNPCKEEKA